MKTPSTTESFWKGTLPGRPFPRLAHDLHVDVAIVGGGITGLTAALLLQRAGLQVAVIEARAVAEGVTGGTTAHLTEEVDGRYAALLRRFGFETVREVASSSRAAIELIAELSREMGDACGFKRVPGYLFTEHAEQRRLLALEQRAARHAGIETVLIDDVPLPFKAVAALRFEDQAELHPREYAMLLAERIVKAGGHVFEGTRADQIADGSPAAVVTEQGTVTASRGVFVATHAPLTKLLLQTKLAAYRSYVIAFAMERPAPAGLFWDLDDPYHYIRSARVGDADVVLVGGEDHKTGAEKETHVHYDRLIEWARARFPLTSVHYRWSAQVIEPVDGLPYIGKAPMKKAVYVATGFSGNGMTFGTLGAMMVRDAILGRENPWSSLYAPTRVKPLGGAKNFFAENVDYPAHLVGDRIKAPEARSVAEVLPGEGKIVRVGGRKLAVSRDEEGRLRALSPVCTHMGCHVAFNDDEKTWDCPCHGARFDRDGRVVDGPAVKPLAAQALPEDEVSLRR